MISKGPKRSDYFLPMHNSLQEPVRGQREAHTQHQRVKRRAVRKVVLTCTKSAVAEDEAVPGAEKPTIVLAREANKLSLRAIARKMSRPETTRTPDPKGRRKSSTGYFLEGPMYFLLSVHALKRSRAPACE